VAREELSDVLSEFARTMLTNFPIQGILDHLVKRIVDIMPVTAAGVTLISPDTKPRYVAASNGQALRFEKLQTDLSEGPCLAAYHSGEAVSVPDLTSEERFPRFTPQALDAGLGAVFTFPLKHDESQLGALDLYRDSAGGLSAESMRAAQTLADVAAAYLLNAQARDDLQDSSDRSREAALHDALTGLPNRVLLLERLEHAFLRGRRSRKRSAVFFVDLDDFKAVNDSYGHQVGDQVLVAVAERLSGALRPGDTLARLSGDEFVILCEDLADPSQVDTIVDRVEAALARPFVLAEIEVSMTASIGIAFTGHGNDAPEELLHDADLAMYQTKRARRGVRQLVDLRELHLPQDQTELAHALPGAEARGELHLEYQPIVAAGDAQLTGVESLLRWKHPSRGVVSPSVVIPLGEKSGLIVGIGRWVLKQAWADRAGWQGHRPDDLFVSVNVSAHQFMSSGFAGTVRDVLNGASADPGLLILEVTESVFVRDGDRAQVVLHELKEMGVTVALDDFGTGDSSLSNLMRYPVDTIKVDRAFIADVGQAGASQTIMNSVIHLAHGLGMTVVAKGVETAEQHLALTGLGCDFCQGFYFARPMPAPTLNTRLQDQTPR
jgi:diguanylate cyclase (GGDEF)-like protein